MMPRVNAGGGGRIGGWLFGQPYLLLALTSLFWAGNVVLGRFVAGHIPPITLSVIRWGGAFLCLLPFAARHLVRDWPTIRKHAALLALLALTGFSAYNTMAYYGLQYTTAINGLLLQSVAPLFVALWTFVLFGDRLTLRQAGGICVSLTGVVVIVCGGAVLLLPAMILEIASGRTIVFDAESVASFAYVCIFPSLLGYLFLNRGIELIGANRAAPFMHLVPVFGSVLAIVLLGERFAIYHAVGYALVFAGVTIATRK